MGYKNKDKQKEYQKNWYHKRRNEFFKDKLCVQCDSKDNLELDHINPMEKITHKIFFWCKEKFDKENEKCQILCNKCHKLKTRKEKAKLTEVEVKEIRRLYETEKISTYKLAKIFSISRRSIYNILNRKEWKDI